MLFCPIPCQQSWDISSIRAVPIPTGRPSHNVLTIYLLQWWLLSSMSSLPFSCSMPASDSKPENFALPPVFCPAQAVVILINQWGIIWGGSKVYTTKDTIQEDFHILEQPDLLGQNVAFEYKQHPTKLLQGSVCEERTQQAPLLSSRAGMPNALFLCTGGSTMGTGIEQWNPYTESSWANDTCLL